MRHAAAGDLRAARELAFWRWWCEGAVTAGVDVDDLPRLSFPAEVGRVGRSVGEFRVHHDPAERRLHLTVEVRGDLSPAVRFRHGEAPLPGDLADFLRLALAGAHVATDGVLVLALQCASAEQFFWRFWTCTEVPERADRAADRRAAWLARRWAEPSGRYRPPGFARGTLPVRLSARTWTMGDGELVGVPDT